MFFAWVWVFCLSFEFSWVWVFQKCPISKPDLNTWCWKLGVTLGAAEWFIQSEVSFMILQSKKWVVYPLDVENLKSHWEQPKGSFLMWVLSCSFNQSTGCWKLQVTLGAAEGFIPSVGSFMLLQSKHLMLKTWKSHWEQPKGCSSTRKLQR